MDPSSPEARAILLHYNLTYDEVIFYQFHHQAGMYVSGLVLVGKTRSENLLIYSCPT